jgi:hypothetical protein
VSKRRRARATKKRKRKPAAEAPPVETSIAAFARDRNVDEKAVRKGIASGRISASCVGLSRSGRRQVITDVEGARRAWDENAARAPQAPAVDGRGSLVEASRLATMERHRSLRIKNDLSEGAVVDVKAAKREAFESYRIIRETLLNLPVRLAAELAGETDPAKVFARLDDAIREALGDAADRLEAAGE